MNRSIRQALRLVQLHKPSYPVVAHRPLSLSSRMAFSQLSTIPLTLPQDLTKEQLFQHPAYKTWLTTLEQSLDLQQETSHPFHGDPYELRSIEVQCCDFFGGQRLGFIKFKADVRNSKDERLPGACFMRGGSVAMLLILQPDTKDGSDEEYVILAVQPRIAAGSLGFIELPASMIDDSGTFGGAAAKEIKEETGLDIKEEELIDMTKLAVECQEGDQASEEDHLQIAIYPSPGGCDEFIPIFLARKRMSEQDIEAMKGKLTGLRDHGEKITLKICKLRDLWKVGARDGKTLVAVALYEGLAREGKV